LKSSINAVNSIIWIILLKNAKELPKIEDTMTKPVLEEPTAPPAVAKD
jgi:hypothetical protein